MEKQAFNWKMFFNPDPNKLTQEILFLKEKKVFTHPIISLNNIQVKKASYPKHLGLNFDEKLTFKHHIDNTPCKVNNGITVIKMLRHNLLRKSLLVIFKVFLNPLMDYGDIIYDKTFNSFFCEKLKSAQFKVTLTRTDASQGTSREKIFQELGLESLKSRRWYRRSSCMFKIKHPVI